MKKRSILILSILIFASSRIFANPSLLGVQPQPFNPSSMLLHSGVAYDASESILGIISLKEPKSFFKPTIDQVTWWGEFKPFKFWGRPELEARLYEPLPPGDQKDQKMFKGEICVLAKATFKMQTPAKEGTWRIDVYSQGQKVDSKNFVVYGGPAAPTLSVSSSTPQ